MKVKQLIQKLKKCNQNLEVGMAAHDNAEGEIAGWVRSVDEVEELEFDDFTEDTHPTGKVVVCLRP